LPVGGAEIDPGPRVAEGAYEVRHERHLGVRDRDAASQRGRRDRLPLQERDDGSVAVLRGQTPGEDESVYQLGDEILDRLRLEVGDYDASTQAFAESHGAANFSGRP